MSASMADHISDMSDMSHRLSRDFDVGFAFELVSSSLFEARLSSFHLGRLKLAQLHFTPHRTRRSTGTLRPSTRHYLINKVVSGEVIVSQDGREAQIGPGDLYLINPSRDFTLDTSDIVTNSIYVDADMFRTAYPEVDCCAAIALRDEDGPVAMVSAMIDNLFRRGAMFGSDAADHCGDAFPYLMAVALASRRERLASCPSRSNLFLKERIKTFARDHLADHALNCEMIADALKLSQRYIYDVFADEELTPMRWIRAERLKRCQRELASAELANRSVSEIAFSWGFVDLAHFSRAFSTRYGMSPRAYRQLCATKRAALN